MSDRLLSPRDVAERAGLSYHAVLRAIKAGELRASSLRGRLRVRPEDYEAWLDAQTVAPNRRRIVDDESPRRRRGHDSSSERGSMARLQAIEGGA